jgi:putative transposase
MKRIPPSTQIRQEISSLLTQGTQEGVNLLAELMKKGLQHVLQEALEQEVTDHLGRGHYERLPEEHPHRGYRNGYEPKHLKTPEGRVEVKAPQLRETLIPYRSRILPEMKGKASSLERLVQEMYVRGLSTRDIERLFEDLQGEPLLSRSAVSQMTETLWKEYEAFGQRDLGGFEILYLFLDAVYESMRLYRGVKEGILVAWGITTEGQKVLLSLGLGNKESYENWLELLRDMVKRGLTVPVLITSDGAPGLIRAIEEVWPRSLRQRCLVHRMRNIVAKLPVEAVPEVKAHLEAVFRAPTYEEGQQMAQNVLRRYQGLYPSAMQAFSEDLEASLSHLRCPVKHRKAIRTTNLLERTFEEERRRSKIIPRFFDEKSCLKLVFATLIRVSARWQRIRITAFELAQIQKLREELKLIPTVKKVKPLRSRNRIRKAA